MLYTRRVQFHEVDAAGLVFFPHFFTWAHEAMEAAFAPLAGGYRALIVERRRGLPAVKVECEFLRPFRYGDVAHLALSVERIGERSLTLRYELRHAPEGPVAARVRHVVVCTDLDALASVPLPDDVRAVAEGLPRAPA